MSKNRMEAFSDGVIAIVITIMVLEMKVPHEADVTSLFMLYPVFLSYILSFLYVGIYWNNHHHLLHSVHNVDGKILWANLHWLFWVTLIPFASGWMGENHFAPTSVTVYGMVLLFSGIAYFVLVCTLIARHGKESHVSQAIGKGSKEKLSISLYMLALGSSLWQPYVALVLYFVVALLWINPDPRIEKLLRSTQGEH
ncbi:MAG: DUF1211 domain-containing protein [Nitrospira sp.]|nr:DUF1211 domain-containing protein [Nitrospira sp.]